MVCKERNINEIYGKADVLSVSDDFGVVNQIELLGRSFAGKSVANYRVLKHGDIVYTKSPLKIKPFGIIKVNYGKTGIVSTLYAVYTPKEGISTSFINYYFAPSHRMNSYIHPLVNKGAKNDMKVSDENVLKGTIKIPSTFEEQVKIASFFCELDEKLVVHQQQLERLKQMKTACLRSMFPSNGGGILPLIRFKGFEGEWLIVKFSDMVQRISTYENSSKLPSVEFEDIVAGEGVLNKDIYRKNVLKRGIRFEEHDVLFGKLRPYLKNILYANFKGIAVGDFWVLRALENIDPYFLYILVSSEAFMDVANISSGSKMPRADWNLVSNSIFAVPSSIAEQRRIASFFRSLDKKISLQSQQIEKLKQMKSACLDKMIA
jgi:type I restriction enzyme S subunit